MAVLVAWEGEGSSGRRGGGGEGRRRGVGEEGRGKRGGRGEGRERSGGQEEGKGEWVLIKCRVEKRSWYSMLCSQLLLGKLTEAGDH